MGLDTDLPDGRFLRKARFRLRSLSYGGQVALPSLRFCYCPDLRCRGSTKEITMDLGLKGRNAVISSVSAAQADSASSYGPIKAALVHMAKGLARQYAPKKIRVNVVSPGTVYFKGGVWHMVEQNMPKRYRDTLARNPTVRMATPQEIANAAVFLASPASSFTTGSNLIVDGATSNRVNF